MKRISLRLIAAAFLSVGLALITSQTVANAAGSASLSLSPSSGSYQVGSSVSVTIRENSGSDPVNVVEVYLSYDASKLQFTGINSGDSAFDAAIDNGGGSGSVHITRYRSGGAVVTGSQIVSRVSFNVLGSSGSTGISFGSGSHIVNASNQQDMWNGSTSGASFSLTAPSTPSTPSTGSGSTGGSTGGSSTGSGSSSSTGSTSTSSGSAAAGSTTKPGTTGTTTTPLLTPEQAQSAEATGDTSQSVDILGTESNGTFLVGIKVFDNKGATLVGAQVKIDDKTVTTDSTGVASFSLTAGKHTADIKSGKRKMRANLTVRDDIDSSVAQAFEVRFTTPARKYWLIAIPVGLLIVVATVVIVVRKRRAKRYRM